MRSEITFRTRKAATTWAIAFGRKTATVPMIRRERGSNEFGKAKGAWVLEVPEGFEGAAGAFFPATIINQ